MHTTNTILAAFISIFIFYNMAGVIPYARKTPGASDTPLSRV